ncbi:MAG: hypothetical protein RL375_4155, partial [Pseudomonadota bacterium]
MTTVASLTIEMAANVARLSRDMARARTTVDGAMAGIRGSVALAQRAFLGLGSGLAAAELLRMADAATTLQNRLKLATGSAREAAVVYREVFTLAQQSRVSFTDLGDTYAKLARNARQLGLSQADMLAVTESIGNALAISGGSAESMNAALVQLGQGFASGVLRGEELNSVMEQTPRLAQAIAEGMGVTIGQLKKLGEEGKLTADVVARAIASQQAQLKAEVGSTTQTVSQALTTVRNAGVLTVGILDDMTGVSGAVAASLTAVANGLTALGEGARAAAPYIKAAWDVIQPILAAAALVAAVTLFGKLAAVFSAVGAALSSIGSIIAGNATLALFLSG